MDELQCALLGSYGGAFTWSANNAVPEISSSIANKMHPFERAMIEQSLPMCMYYMELQTFVDECLLMKQKNLYLAALGLPVQEFLEDYEIAVLALENASDLHALRQSYGFTMQSLLAIIRQLIDAVNRSKGTTSPLNYLEPPTHLPRDLYEKISIASTLQLLRHIAHWVAHGHVLSYEKCGFFIEHPVDNVASASLLVNIVPKRISLDVANIILETGKNRSLLGKLVTHKESVKAYHTVTTPEGIIYEGQLNTNELTSRVRRLKELWSKKIWEHVCSSTRDPESTFPVLLQRFRSYYMCSQGDLWLKFVHNTFDMFFNVWRPLNSLPNDSDAFSRKIQVAFSSCVSSSGLDETYPSVHARVRHFELQTNTSERSVEQLAESILQRIRALGLLVFTANDDDTMVDAKALESQCTYSMVFDSAAIQRYNQLFELHVRCKFVQDALHQTHRLYLSLAKSDQYDESTLRPLMQTLHDMNFFMDNFVYYLQMDVQDTLYTKAIEKMKEVGSVENAKEMHDKLLNELLGRCYLTESNTQLREGIYSVMLLCVALYVLCHRFLVDEQRGSYLEELVHNVLLLSRKFQTLMVSIYRQLQSSSDNKALLTRMDFNRWLSTVCMHYA